MTRENLLMVGDTERDANMLYAVGLLLPDPFIYLRLRKRCHLVVADMEVERLRKHADHCRVMPLGGCLQKLRAKGVDAPSQAHVIALILRDQSIRKVTVPGNFPIGLARDLRKLKVKLRVEKGGFFPERAIKTAEEVKKISAALMMAEVGLAEGIQALKNAKIGKAGRLMRHNLPLTSEKLRSIIDVAIMQAGGAPNHTIVACGQQGCNPHERGFGPLRANQPIILDVFPRSQRTGYFGDITRTVVKGRASEGLRKLHDTVVRGQEIAFDRIRHGKSGAEVHRAVHDFFDREGYKTGKSGGRMQGFFHGTGHGLGLELHESPRISAHSKETLQAGHVITVEPGLYYPGLGGVRIEDVALVTAKNPRNLTKFEKVLEV